MARLFKVYSIQKMLLYSTKKISLFPIEEKGRVSKVSRHSIHLMSLILIFSFFSDFIISQQAYRRCRNFIFVQSPRLDAVSRDAARAVFSLVKQNRMGKHTVAARCARASFNWNSFFN